VTGAEFVGTFAVLATSVPELLAEVMVRVLLSMVPDVGVYKKLALKFVMVNFPLLLVPLPA
jgi:hypothetical protein